ncbi:MAG: hypothetical protein QM493_07950 [Sulfurovum sp.]
MRKILENLAIMLVILLSLAIIYLIVRYNMIEDETTQTAIVKEEPKKEAITQKAKASNYLQNLEGYNDVDVQVDAKEEDTSNRVTIVSESNINEIQIEKIIDNKTDTQIIEEEGTNKVDKVGKALDNLLDDL